MAEVTYSDLMAQHKAGKLNDAELERLLGKLFGSNGRSRPFCCEPGGDYKGVPMLTFSGDFKPCRKSVSFVLRILENPKIVRAAIARC